MTPDEFRRAVDRVHLQTFEVFHDLMDQAFARLNAEQATLNLLIRQLEEPPTLSPEEQAAVQTGTTYSG